MSYKELVDRIIADGVLTSKEYLELLETANKDGVLDAEEREGILKVLKMKEEAKLKLFSKD